MTNSAPSDIGTVNNTDTIYVAWTEGTGNKTNIFMTRSVDDGDTFEKPIKLISNNSLNPALIHISNESSTGLSWTEYVIKPKMSTLQVYWNKKYRSIFLGTLM
jgi:hypothetical protein